MSKFEKELERFVNDYYADHDTRKQEIQNWGNEVERDLMKLASEGRKFEYELEKNFTKLEKWLTSKKRHFENTFDNN